MKKNYEDEGVFIEEPMIYEDISDLYSENAESIEEEALITDVEDF